MKTQKGYCRERRSKGLFVSDLDGTLLTDEKRIGPYDLSALATLQQMGYLTAIATGRSNYSVNTLINSLGYSGPESTLPVDYIIFSTGAGIMDFPGGSLMKSVALGPEDVLFISDYLETSGLDYMIHRPVPDTRHFLFSFHGEDNPDFLARLNLYREFATPLSTAFLEGFGGATEVLCILPQDRAHERAARIADSLKQFSVIKATSPLDGKSIWVEIFNPAVSKGQAVEWLAETVGVRREHVCAVGNDYNDEDLLHWAARSFIVGNNPATMQSHFQTVASNNEGGVSEAIANWLAASQSRNRLS